jgi:hypothetical protein
MICLILISFIWRFFYVIIYALFRVSSRNDFFYSVLHLLVTISSMFVVLLSVSLFTYTYLSLSWFITLMWIRFAFWSLYVCSISGFFCLLVGALVSSVTIFLLDYSSLMWVGCGLLPFIFLVWEESCLFRAVFSYSR